MEAIEGPKNHITSTHVVPNSITSKLNEQSLCTTSVSSHKVIAYTVTMALPSNHQIVVSVCISLVRTSCMDICVSDMTQHMVPLPMAGK